MANPIAIRFPDELKTAIEHEALLDHRDFSDEVRMLCRIGLEKRSKLRSTSLSAEDQLEEARRRA